MFPWLSKAIFSSLCFFLCFRVTFLYWRRSLQTHISPELFQISYIPFRRILKLCAFSLNVERVRFVLRLLQNAPPFAHTFLIPLVKSVDGPAIECSMNDFLRNCQYVNKDRGVVD